MARKHKRGVRLETSKREITRTVSKEYIKKITLMQIQEFIFHSTCGKSL